MKSLKKNGVVLNQEKAKEIYQYKVRLLASMSYKESLQPMKQSMRGEASKLAKSFGLSAKTIRDIWNKRTWTEATSDLQRCENGKMEEKVNSVV